MSVEDAVPDEAAPFYYPMESMLEILGRPSWTDCIRSR
jgi:hypothetical protein